MLITDTDFKNAQLLKDATLSNADLANANLRGGENLTPEQVKAANN